MLEYTYKGAYTYVYTDQDSYEPLAHVFHNNKDAQLYLSYYHTDQIGIPREQTDQFGNLLWLGDYTAWGSLKDETKVYPNAHQPFRLQNQYYDHETGLHYNFFRYYAPEMGRFTTQDPVGLLGGDNLYLFAPNSQTWIDPLGLVKQSASTGKYNIVGGHHIHAKAAWNNLPNSKFIADNMFSIDNDWMKKYGIIHSKITSCQRREFKKLKNKCNQNPELNTMEEHSKIAKICLIEGGATEELAEKLVQKSLEYLNRINIAKPNKIPWG